MYIRSATEEDIPDIVNLLKVSLGETLMPKSEAFWRWKHIDNPFGRSPVLIATEEGKLIGVRAFMRWEWSQGTTILKAVRAVDTATHPEYQGKGIFKKLTLQLVDQCKEERIHFIFNTPNTNSKPGYLSMGWRSLGRMKIFVRPVFNLGSPEIDFEERYRIKAPLQETEMSVDKPHTWSTHSSTSFLNWRYKANPNIQYFHFSDVQNPSAYQTIFRLKPHRLGVEFRICHTSVLDKSLEKQHLRHLMEVVYESGANVITAAMPLGRFSLGISRGPEVTMRELTSLYNSLSFKNWLPTLGDIEVF